MHLYSRRHKVGTRGRQVSLSLLVLLVSHVLLMVTPLHDVVARGGSDARAAMVEPSAHGDGDGCIDPADHGAHARGDCAIQGNTPARSGLDLPLPPIGSSRLEPSRPAGLMPVPLERTTWPPPLLDLQVLFRVFRI